MNPPEVINDDKVGKESNNSNSIVKIMEKKSKIFVVDSYKFRAGIETMTDLIAGAGSKHRISRALSEKLSEIKLGDSIESYPFVVGEYSFTMHFFPMGGVEKKNGFTSLYVENHSSKTAHVAFELIIVHGDVTYGWPDKLCLGSSYFHRHYYHEVVRVEPGCRCGSTTFISYNIIFSCIPTKSLWFKAKLLVVDFDQPPPKSPSFDFERCILFQVGGRSYYAQESVITRRCPALLSNYSSSNHFVVIPDVEPNVFEAVLWFLHNKDLHRNDKEAIANSKDSFDLKMVAAAEKFMLKDLGRRCKYLIKFGDSVLLDCYYGTESDVTELWGNVSSLSWLPQQMKELIPQKMKLA